MGVPLTAGKDRHLRMSDELYCSETERSHSLPVPLRVRPWHEKMLCVIPD